MRLEILNNKREFEEWAKIANLSNFSTEYSTETPIECINVDKSFEQEMKRVFKSSKKVKTILDAKDPLYLLLALKDEKNKIVGTVSIKKDYHKSYACQINSVAIHPQYRGKGYGKLLIRETKRFVSSSGKYYYVTLTTSSSHTFYENIGMKLAGILNIDNHERYFFYDKL